MQHRKDLLEACCCTSATTLLATVRAMAETKIILKENSTPAGVIMEGAVYLLNFPCWYLDMMLLQTHWKMGLSQGYIKTQAIETNGGTGHKEAAHPWWGRGAATEDQTMHWNSKVSSHEPSEASSTSGRCHRFCSKRKWVLSVWWWCWKFKVAEVSPEKLEDSPTWQCCTWSWAAGCHGRQAL